MLSANKGRSRQLWKREEKSGWVKERKSGREERRERRELRAWH